MKVKIFSLHNHLEGWGGGGGCFFFNLWSVQCLEFSEFESNTFHHKVQLNNKVSESSCDISKKV